MTDAPEPPPPEPTPAPAPQAPPQTAPARNPPWLPIMIGVAAAVLLIAGLFVWRTQFAGVADQSAYTVQPYSPPTEIVSARDRVPGRAAPDDASLTEVQFGPGVTLNVTGRVSRGLGNDWYAVAWNEKTVFVRVNDAVAGSGAPPTPDVREETPEEEVDEDKPDVEEDPFAEEEEEEVAETPSVPSSGSLDISDVDWIREPNARDFARFYPREALNDDRSGRVTLDCVIAGSGRLDCSVANESPSGYGFGGAAIDISRQVRVQPTLPDGSPAAGRRLRLPLTFRAG